jgi:hypothetical protein
VCGLDVDILAGSVGSATALYLIATPCGIQYNLSQMNIEFYFFKLVNYRPYKPDTTGRTG